MTSEFLQTGNTLNEGREKINCLLSGTTTELENKGITFQDIILSGSAVSDGNLYANASITGQTIYSGSAELSTLFLSSLGGAVAGSLIINDGLTVLGNITACTGSLYVTNIFDCGSELTFSKRDSGFSSDNFIRLTSTGTIFGDSGNTASGLFSIAGGTGTIASNFYSVALGNSNTSSGIASFSVGDNNNASGDYSHAEGRFNSAQGNYSHAEGNSTTAFGNNSHAEGSGTQATGENSHAEGFNTTASGNYSHAQGRNTQAIGLYAHAQGWETFAYGTHSFAGGRLSYNTGNTAFVFGSGSTAYTTANYSTVVSTSSSSKSEGTAIIGGINNHIDIDSPFTIFVGGSGHTSTEANNGAVIGGLNNNLDSGGMHSAIIGGTNNTTTASGVTVLGGEYVNASQGNTAYLPNIIIHDPISAPIVSGATGVKGSITYDDNYLYVCYQTNSWGRISLEKSF